MVLSRLSRDQMLMEIAHVVAQRGTCSRLQVGAVFALEGRILATGYNGAPRGIDHCTHETYTWPSLRELDNGDYRGTPEWMLRVLEHMEDEPDPGKKFYWDGTTVSNREGCNVAEHAERNAVGFAAGRGIALGNCDLYVTHAPCLDCSRTLLNVGVARVIYDIPYRLTAGLDLLSSVGIRVIDYRSLA